MSASIATLDQVLPWHTGSFSISPTSATTNEKTFRFTMDGDEGLEHRLDQICQQVAEGVREIVPSGMLDGLLLAGGYGRGEGGVLETPEGHQPYNDMEFYVFLRGSTLLNDCRYKAKLHALGERLSGPAGLEVEFKVLSLAKLRRAEVSMFSYDFVVGHHWLVGDDSLFHGCDHHRDASHIPMEEASRLLFNRCSGLLFALERLRRGEFTPEDADFVGRNLAKSQLGLGDAILAACGLYHWSCRERHRRLVSLQEKSVADRSTSDAVKAFQKLLGSPALGTQLIGAHEAGTAFKLHPRRSTHGRNTLAQRHQELVSLTCLVWRRLESLRLKHEFNSASDYASSSLDKCPGRPAWRNRLVNARTFGIASAFATKASRYPRESLFHSLAWLLWHGALDSEVLPRVQRELRTSASDFSSLVKAYESLWHRFN